MNRRRCVALLVGLVALAACGVQTDESPRDIADAQRGPLGTANGTGGGAASGTERIYLVGPATSGEVPLLEPVARTAGTPTELLEALLAGANSAELEQQLRSAIPAGTELNSVGLQAGTLRVDLSTELPATTSSMHSRSWCSPRQSSPVCARCASSSTAIRSCGRWATAR